MPRFPLPALLPAAFLAAAAQAALAAPGIQGHDLTVRFEPAEAKLAATDVVRLRRDGGGPLVFTLHSKLAISAAAVDGAAVTPEKVSDDGWRTTWKVDVPAGDAPGASLRIEYAGTVHDGVAKSGDLSFVVGDDSRGAIMTRGIYLAESSAWYPNDGGMATFVVRTHDPAGFSVVTQGTRHAPPAPGEPVVWKGKYPSDGLSLVAGPWESTRRTVRGVEIGTHLTAKNAAGAKVLLDAAETYLAKYADLLGPYAYDRFDIVENWFTTGYGMPEFTLLGGDVIARMLAEAERKGGIPPGYLDHEIVHCWWGNLVYPDYEKGNWCEALTTYCSNYIAKEWTGAAEAAEHRRVTSLRFALRVTPANDYPVREFRTKEEASDDDIGYGKGSMFFHSLRREIGDAAFWETLRRTARERRGHRITWDDWRAEFETTSGRNLTAFFAQGLDRAGAPHLSLAGAASSADAGGFRVTGTLVQTGEPWRIAVPVVVEHLGGVEEAVIDVSAAETPFSVRVPALPLRVSIDPAHHVFRTLTPAEIPACLAATLSRPKVTVVHPDGDEALAAVARMAARRDGIEVVPASKAGTSAEPGRSWLLLGDPDRVPVLASLRAKLPRHFPPQGADGAKATVLASSRSPADPAEFVTSFVGAPEALATRARAVYYYQFDGRIGFEGPIPRERSAAQAPSRTTALLMPDFRAQTSPERAADLVKRLAAPEMNGRLAGSADEARARKLVMDELRVAGVEASAQPFSFVVRRLAPGVDALAGAAGPVAGAVPFLASPETPEAGVAASAVVAEDAADVSGKAVLVDLGAADAAALTFVRSAAQMAKARGAVALLARMPERPSQPMSDLWAFPESLHPDVAARLAAAAERGGSGDPGIHCAGVEVRTGSDVACELPVVAVPRGFDAAAAGAVTVRVRYASRRIESANVVARIAAKGSRRDGAVLVSAHLDHLGEGFPGADDNASGVAAVLEAVHVLAGESDSLSRDVWIAFFGAEEWGLRGSRAFAASLPEAHGIAAVVNADTVGRAGVDEVSVVGVSMHPAAARVVSAALERSGLAVGRDVDRHAFAWGSDHWTFHQRGIPSIDLWSGDYRAMHTRDDVPEKTDAAKIARIGRAIALSAMALAASR
ncbi:MAG: hypothetical protein HMLKMBBP_03583 [Planctomycetes bacterium]|nr:hypothetical protein [Planctomycetota bacterium]